VPANATFQLDVHLVTIVVEIGGQLEIVDDKGHLPTRAPGKATVLIKNLPQPERSVRPILLISLCSGIL